MDPDRLCKHSGSYNVARTPQILPVGRNVERRAQHGTRGIIINSKNFMNQNNNKRTPDNPMGEEPKKKNRFSIYWIYGLIGLTILGVNVFRGVKPAGVETDQQKFYRMVTEGDIEKIKTIRNKKLVRVFVNADSLKNKSTMYHELLADSQEKDKYERAVKSNQPQLFFSIIDDKTFATQMADFYKSNPTVRQVPDSPDDEGEFFSQAGKTARQVGYLTKGAMRVCFYGVNGEEFTRCFMEENRFAVDYNSFLNELPCAEYVEALTDCEMLVFEKPDFTELANTIPDWSPIITKIMAAAMMRKVSEAHQMLSEDATARYLTFLEKNPGLANRIPLSILASYLGITQSSLSRIRKNL
ncbi:MAG: cyclic nucleotide-binding domain-containing protein [Chitinophagaceae bacterium]|nr:MAG: cyclic nucleotide-binding domain-containing protein [Chitinophagaceae bacterium]